MKNETKIDSGIARIKECIGSSGARRTLLAAGLMLVFFFLFFGYKPLIGELQGAANRLQEVETELSEQHQAIAALEKVDVKGKMIQQNEIPLAIDELTEKGREFGLRFTSISPSQLQETMQSGIWKLPISFVIESEYQNLGQFLDYIETSSRNIAALESLSINPKEENLSGLSVALVLNLYVEKKHETK
ncbi:MAG: type 4a pilus biogenesis protein PilO [Deltaproteobacteria bacterium]|nr:type 4a pilus biogenesis protein PilO [Deltaproteobacteria bacterium]